MKKIGKNRRLKVIISVICIIAIIGIIIGANVIKVNIAKGKYSSSNSGSNNGNLIPEYIKEGITLGGITGTLKVLDTSDATAKPEDILYGKTAYVNGVKITGSKITKEILKIGDYVEYTPDTASAYSLTKSITGYTSNQSISQETLKWRIMSINEDGTLDLISSTPTSTKIGFGSALGYNNGVYLLNDIAAKLYSNVSLGVTARSLKIEDLESRMSEEGIETAHSYSGSEVQWGKTWRAVYGRYPNIYAKENGSGIGTTTIKKDGIGPSESYYTTPTTSTTSEAGTNKLTVTQTHYYIEMNENYYINEEFFKVIHNGGVNWLSSRCVGTYYYDVWFGISTVVDSYISAQSLIRSEAYYEHGKGAWGLRPVVTLNSNVKFTSGDGSIENPYKISI